MATRKCWAGSQPVARAVGLRGGLPSELPPPVAAGAFEHVPRERLNTLVFFVKTWEK
jgi:hypothetical protein